MEIKKTDCIRCGKTIEYGPEVYMIQTSVAGRHGIGGSVIVHNHPPTHHRIIECQDFVIASCVVINEVSLEVNVLLDLIKAYYDKQLEEDMTVAAG